MRSLEMNDENWTGDYRCCRCRFGLRRNECGKKRSIIFRSAFADAVESSVKTLRQNS